MKISALNGVSTVRNYGKVKNNIVKNKTNSIEEQKQDRNLLDYPKNYMPSFGIIESFLTALAFSMAIGVPAAIYESHLDKKYAKEREEEKQRVVGEISNDIQRVADKFNVSFEEAKIYQDKYLSIASIKPSGDGNEIGLNSVMGYGSEKYKLAVDFITPIVAKEKGVLIDDVDVPNGLLLYGPVGSGKTYMVDKTSEHLRHFGVQVEDIVLSQDDHEGNAELIRETFEKGKERFKETGKYTVINFQNDLDNIFASRSCSSETMPEISEFLASAENCAQEGVTWIGSSNNPKRIDSAVLRAGRTDIKIPIGNMKNFAVADMLRYALIKNDDLVSAEGLDYQYIVDIMKEDLLIFTPAEIDEIVKEAKQTKLEPDQVIDANELLDIMHNRNYDEVQTLNPKVRSKFRDEQLYMEEIGDASTKLLSKATTTSIETDAERKIIWDWPVNRPTPVIEDDGEELSEFWKNIDNLS